MNFLYPQGIDLTNFKVKNGVYWRILTNRVWKVFCLFAFCFGIFVWINLRWSSWYGTELEPRCQVPEEELEDMRMIGRETKDILDKHNMTFVLGFGSLWGALRIGDILPWDIDIDILVIVDRNSDIRGTIDGLIVEMKEQGMDVYYRDWVGIIQGYSPVYKSQLDVSFWCDYYGMGIMHRCSGWESWFFFIHHRYNFAFPARLVKTPLPTLNFVKRNWTVPREGIELQKVHYPNDWWKVAKPRGC